MSDCNVHRICAPGTQAQQRRVANPCQSPLPCLDYICNMATTSLSPSCLQLSRDQNIGSVLIDCRRVPFKSVRCPSIYCQ
ncbi:hypothetical protein BC835DRAFT_1318665 [Cytidiella melzeri]|nr:hypothetical protein BC835DRAFT_1318665 [Cytidiella melzeri]